MPKYYRTYINIQSLGLPFEVSNPDVQKYFQNLALSKLSETPKSEFDQYVKSCRDHACYGKHQEVYLCYDQNKGELQIVSPLGSFTIEKSPTFELINIFPHTDNDGSYKKDKICVLMHNGDKFFLLSKGIKSKMYFEQVDDNFSEASKPKEISVFFEPHLTSEEFRLLYNEMKKNCIDKEAKQIIIKPSYVGAGNPIFTKKDNNTSINSEANFYNTFGFDL